VRSRERSRWAGLVGAAVPSKMTTAIPRLLAQAFLNGKLQRAGMIKRGAELLGQKWKWLGPLATRFLKEFGGAKPRLGDAVRFLRHDEGLCVARAGLRIAKWTPSNGVAAMRWKLPEMESPAALAEWLGLTDAEVAWFADRKNINKGKSSHYTYCVFEKPGKPARLIEAPKTRMKELLRRLLTDVFEKIPVHAAAHGFVARHSIKTFAAPHAGQPCLLKMDLANFFPSISRARVESLLITAGYDERVAELLAGICTNRAPRDVAPDPIYTRPHLPQGAPTSPAIANLCMFRADRRLRGLAESAGAVYTRYADDLAFSGASVGDRSALRIVRRTHLRIVRRTQAAEPVKHESPRLRHSRAGRPVQCSSMRTDSHQIAIRIIRVFGCCGCAVWVFHDDRQPPQRIMG